MTKLPDRLSRKAISQTFDRISPVGWEKLFEREDQNGLGKLRVEGDYEGRAYYDLDGLMQWLVRNGHYTMAQIQGKTAPGVASALTIRTHLLAG